MNEEDDFTIRCLRLGQFLKEYQLLEMSPRVWSCVLSDMLLHIILEQKNPERAFEQCFSCIKNTMKEEMEARQQGENGTG